MKKINIIELDNFNQLSLFFLLLNNPKGLFRKEITNRLDIPRTTIYDNLYKLQKRKIIKKYNKRTNKKGRPKVIWYVPKYIRTNLLHANLSEKIKIKQDITINLGNVNDLLIDYSKSKKINFDNHENTM